MRVVTGRDAHEVRAERPGIHHHTLKVLELVRAPGSPPLDLGAVRVHLAERLAHDDRLQPLRWRLATVGRGRLLPPAWVVVDPDLDHHVRPASIEADGPGPGPGANGSAEGLAALDPLLGTLLETPLDPDRPRWQLHLVDGLEERQALVLVVHHAIGGGTEVAGLLEALFGPSAPARPAAPVDAEPGTGALLALAGRRLVDLARRTPELPAARRQGRLPPGSEPEAPGVRPFDAPVMSWNRGLAGRRRTGSVVLPLPEVVRVGRRRGATVNEVLLAVVGGALLALASSEGQRPDRSLTAVVPVHRGRPGSPSGNHATSMAVDLVTQEPDLLRRLDRVAAASRLAKAQHLRASPLPVFAVSEVGTLHTASIALGLVVGRLLRRATFTTVVSLVRAPAAAMSVGASEVAAITSFGEVTADIGCNVTAWSRGDRLDVGITGCAGLDAPALARRLRVAFDELAAAVDAVGSIGATTDARAGSVEVHGG